MCGERSVIVSIDKINEEAPYCIQIKSLQPCLVLTFVTDRLLVYDVTFIKDNILKLPDIYQLIIEEQSGLHSSYDPKIQKTIILILDSFFKERNRVLAYICDIRDSRQEVRDYLFHRWFMSCQKGFVKYRKTVHTEDIIFYSSIICRQDNPNLENIKSTYYDFIEELQK